MASEKCARSTVDSKNNSTGSTDASFLLMAACLGLSAALMPVVARINRTRVVAPVGV